MAAWPHGGCRGHGPGAAPRALSQAGLEVLYDADSPYDGVRWLRQNGLRARVWKIPATPDKADSMLFTRDLTLRRVAAGPSRLAAPGCSMLSSGTWTRSWFPALSPAEP